MLDLIEKRTSVPEIEKALKWAHEAGIWSYVNFITGMPYEADADFEETLAFIRRNGGFIDDYQCGIFQPRPPSSFFYHPERFGNRLLEQVKYASRGTDDIAYEEVDGLGWEEKRQRNEMMRKAVYQALQEHTPLDVFVPVQTLFHLYGSLGDKEQVRKWLKDNYRQALSRGIESTR